MPPPPCSLVNSRVQPREAESPTAFTRSSNGFQTALMRPSCGLHAAFKRPSHGLHTCAAITFHLEDGRSTAPNHSQPPFPQSQRPAASNRESPPRNLQRPINHAGTSAVQSTAPFTFTRPAHWRLAPHATRPPLRNRASSASCAVFFNIKALAAPELNPFAHFPAPAPGAFKSNQARLWRGDK